MENGDSPRVCLADVLRRCVGQRIVINSNEELLLASVGEDFLVLQGGNPQLRITEFVPIGQVVKLIRADYEDGHFSLSIDLALSGGDQQRNTDFN